MGRMDRRARSYTLNGTLALVIAFTFYASAGLMQLVKYFVGRDSFYLFAGLINTVVGCFMVYFGVRLLRAVVRRLQSEAHTDAPPSS